MEKENPSVENLLLRMKLESMFGGEIFMPKLDDLEKENLFLRNIIELEEMELNAPKVSVYTYIDSPYYLAANDIPADEMEKALKDLVGYMNEKGIYLEMVDSYPDEIIYRFIVEELFWVTLSNVKLPGMESCFIYEDYHPNPRVTIELLSTELLDGILKMTPGCFKYILTDFCNTPTGNCYSNSAVFDKIETYIRNSTEIIQSEFQISTVSVRDENSTAMTAVVAGNLSFTSSGKNSSELVTGYFEFNFKHDQGFWELYHFTLPGFEW